MALIECIECAKLISNKAIFCPNCGYPLEQNQSQEKYLLTVKEAGEYFGIGQNKIRDLIYLPNNSFSILNGNKYLINKKKFEKFLDGVNQI
jgi:excisionase family DNA binding protein